MINELTEKKYCKDDISLIENYNEAMNDPTQTWDCHHRDEIRTLPSGITVLRSRVELIECGRYYNCPSNELIFIKHSEHTHLHKKDIKHSEETKKKIGESGKGRHWKLNDNTKKKISEAKKKIRESYMKDNFGLSWNDFQKFYSANI